MIKNTASQVIGAQMLTAADGTAFTGTVTCYVTGDGGTQGLGGTGSGVCTHEGNGYHTYVPTQAETNYNLIAFTFIGTAAVPATIQVFTINARQTGDSYARLGAPAGASVSADVAAVKGDTAAILEDTGTTLSGQITTIATDTTTDIPALIAAAEAKIDIIDTNVDQIETAVITNAAGTDIAADIIAIKAETAAILEDTGTTLSGQITTIATDTTTDIPALIATAQADLDIITGATGVNLLAATQASIDAIETDTTTDIPALIDALPTAAEIWATAMSDLATGAPSATASVLTAINYLYEAWRNKTTTTATLLSVKKDDATTDLCKATISDDATTFTKEEFVSG